MVAQTNFNQVAHSQNEYSFIPLTLWCCSKVVAWASGKTPNIEMNSGQGWDLFWSDWREAFLISGSYGMGDPMAPSDSEGNSEGGGRARRSREPSGEAGGHHPSVTP